MHSRTPPSQMPHSSMHQRVKWWFNDGHYRSHHNIPLRQLITENRMSWSGIECVQPVCPHLRLPGDMYCTNVVTTLANWPFEICAGMPRNVVMDSSYSTPYKMGGAEHGIAGSFYRPLRCLWGDWPKQPQDLTHLPPLVGVLLVVQPTPPIATPVRSSLPLLPTKLAGGPMPIGKPNAIVYGETVPIIVVWLLGAAGCRWWLRVVVDYMVN
jgi:hypothetical protein